MLQIRQVVTMACFALSLVVEGVWAADIPAGVARFSQAKPAFESDKLGTGSDGGSTVTNTYILASENGFREEELCDLIIVLEDDSGKQIPADVHNDIESVSVQPTVNGELQGEPVTYPQSGQATAIKADLDPCIPHRESEEQTQAGAQIKVTAKTNTTFNRIHVTVSKKSTAADHYTVGGTVTGEPGSTGTVSVPALSTGCVFFVEHVGAAGSEVGFVRASLIGHDLPAIAAVEVQGANQPFTPTIEPGGTAFTLTGGQLEPGGQLEIWVRFGTPAVSRVALFVSFAGG